MSRYDVTENVTEWEILQTACARISDDNEDVGDVDVVVDEDEENEDGVTDDEDELLIVKSHDQ